MSNTLIPISVNAPQDQGLASFMKIANAAPVLTAEQEIALANDFQDNNNLEAAKELVISHMRYVIRVAKGFSGYGLPIADLIQEGNIGLMKAVKSYDPNRGVRLVSFASKSMTTSFETGRLLKLQQLKHNVNCFLICAKLAKV